MISRKVTNEKSFSLSRKRGEFEVDRFNIGMEKARSTKGRAKRKPRYKFIRGACLVGVGSDAARAANLFRRGKGTSRAREDEAAAAIKSFHYLNWVLLVGTCNQFFSPTLNFASASYPLVTPSTSLAEMNALQRKKVRDQRVAWCSCTSDITCNKRFFLSLLFSVLCTMFRMFVDFYTWEIMLLDEGWYCFAVRGMIYSFNGIGSLFWLFDCGCKKVQNVYNVEKYIKYFKRKTYFNV